MAMHKLFYQCSVIVFVLCICCDAAGSKKKEGSALDTKVSQLTDMAAKRAVIRMDAAKFNNFVKSPPRNYSFIVMFTALASYRECAVCREANGEYEMLADAWRRSPDFSPPRLFFAVVDYDDGPEVFSALGLNSAPFFIHFPPKGKNKKTDTLDINRVGFSAEALAKFVLDKTTVHVRFVRPPNYTNIALILLVFALIGALVYFKRNDLKFFHNKSAWATATLAIIFTMTSGQMWNHIRGPPMFNKNHQNGQVDYIHPYSDSQLVAETYIVFALNATIVIGMILLNDACAFKTAAGKKRVLAVCGIASVVFFFSLLLSVFRSKYQGYPYRLIFQ